jgi:hypothetical protein
VDCCWPEEPAVLKPWQPIREVRPARRSNAPAAFQRCLEEIALAAVSSIASRGPVAQGLRLSPPRGRAHHESGAVGGIAVDV